ncbi:hypothetical protein C483_15337 [Natrialba hulunbeirensis JCM 10989]|uniref:Uncharacterized protein n=1 Tax=Natrialba hulunbeirensis JCM 10989 TaxID=1227493 RepID=L9ZRL0_9EURY|nr:hypothetical protein [Natrialba hulunbeirensis]ELY88721.1 hypothetical protein C483_15337 [Natrialba hulunbeirensis JCM 10989]
MSAEKRIPVTEETFKELGDMKQAGQTWDELLEELAAQRKHQQFKEDMKQIKENEEFVPLDEV